MSFTVTGRIGAQSYTVTWDEGEITGDDAAVDAIEAYADAHEGKRIGSPTGPFTEVDHLSDPLSAAMIMDEVFDEITAEEGDVPKLPDVPDGAIA